MSDLLKKSLIRIQTSQGKTAGAGFLLTPELAVTCAHVVEGAGSGPGRPVKISSYSQDHSVDAHVLEKEWSPPGQNDVAFVRLDQPIPDLVPVNLHRAATFAGKSFRVLGFPLDPNYQADTAQGKIGSILPVSVPGRAPILQVQGKEIRKGMSGGPIMEVDSGLVVGMVCEYQDREHVRRGYAVAADTILDLAATVSASVVPMYRMRKSYLDFLVKEFKNLELRNFSESSDPDDDIALEDIFISLRARKWNKAPYMESVETRGGAGGRAALLGEALPSEGERRESDVVPIMDVFAKSHHRLVVLGGPGSGKTTLLRYYTLLLAKNFSGLLPIYLPLSTYIKKMDQANLSLSAYMQDYYRDRMDGDVAPLFQEAVQSGKAVLLLDGLEDSHSHQAELAAKIDRFARENVGHNYIVVTSRVATYRESSFKEQDWPVYMLEGFGPEDIELFIARWCSALEKGELQSSDDSNKEQSSLQTRLKETLENNPGVFSLASTPLLLTLLAIINRRRQGALRSRITLYDRYLKMMVKAWLKNGELKNIPALAALSPETLLKVWGLLALRKREENLPANLVERETLQGWLAAQFTGDQWGIPKAMAQDLARVMVTEAHQIANLLIERGDDLFEFIHPTFEEALAAFGLVEVGETDPQSRLDIIVRHLNDPAWEETILLSVGVLGLVRRRPILAGELVSAILNAQSDPENSSHNLILAGKCLEEVGKAGIGSGAAKKLQETLLAASRNRSLDATVQRDAGFLLGRSGWVLEDLDEWIRIPAGKFKFGNSRRVEEIGRPFEIQKYPVTNQQFARFTDARGYDQREYWSDTGWDWRTGKYDATAPQSVQGWLSHRPQSSRNEPRFWHDKKWNNPLAPVVGVTFYEADAFANWYTSVLQRKVTLATEHQWERAAAGTEGREYAYEGSYDRGKANCANFWNLRRTGDYIFNVSEASTTIVIQFNNGATPEGVLDLTGNVWEWTQSNVLRGGAWNYFSRAGRCTSRMEETPVISLNCIGFRLVSEEF